MGRVGLVTVVVALVVTASVSACGGGSVEPEPSTCPSGTGSTGGAAAYRGVLVDALVALESPGVAAELACPLEVNDVRQAALVAPMDPSDTFATESAYRTATAGQEGTFLPFFELPEGSGPDDVDRILREVGLFFRGMWVDDLSSVPGALVDAASARALLVAGPAPDSLAVLDRLLGDHPGASVLVSAERPLAGLPDLLREHDGLVVVMQAPGLGSGDEWLPVVQAAPERVLWGSGVTSVEAASASSYDRVIADVRALLGGLPRPMREAVAATNARRLFGLPHPEDPDV